MSDEANELDKIYPGIEKQTTFATALTLTSLAKKSQSKALDAIEEKFTVRGNWAQPSNRFGVHTEIATKSNLESAVKTSASWLIPHETGQDKTADGGNIAVPTVATRPNITDKITTAKRPRNLVGAFKLTTRTGATSIFKRINRVLVPLYRLVRSAHIEKNSTIIEPTIKTVEQELGNEFGSAMRKAFDTQK